MSGNLLPAVDYLVSLVQAYVGHARVYNRRRSTRSRAKFDSLFVGADGLDFWICRRTSSDETHAGPGNHATRVHSIQITGTRAASAEPLDVDAPELQLQDDVEALAELIRTDPTLGWNVEKADATAGGVEEIQVASIACHQGALTVQAREDRAW